MNDNDEDRQSEDRADYSAPADWPHAPTHRLSEFGTFIVTASTFRKERLFDSAERLDALTGGLHKYARMHGWQMQAWAVFPNHYHFVAHRPEAGTDLGNFLAQLHSRSAAWINRRDDEPGRKVWHNFWETQITFERSYLARLNYVHNNPVKHGVVPVANQYKWCSAAWFERNSTPAQQRTIYRFKTDKLKIDDDF